MSIRYDLAEFYDDAIDRSQDFGFQVADRSRRVLCSIWQNTPGALIPNPGDSFRRGAVSALCQDFEPPPPPAPPFTGGQCPAFYSVTAQLFFKVKSSGEEFDVGPVGVGVFLGPISQSVRQNGQQWTLFIREGNGNETATIGSSFADNDFVGGGITSAVRSGGVPDTCGNPDPVYPGGDVVNEGDVVNNENITVEGDRNTEVTIDFSPTFEDEVCIGQFVFCADVEGNRVTLDAGGVTINLPGTGGGDSGGGDGGSGDTITNIDTTVTNIREAQEECCSAIIQSISSFRNRATELFNEGELRDACIVGLIRNSTQKVPRFEGGASIRASGSTGVLGSVVTVQPLGGDSCFLRVDITPTEQFTGKRYKILSESSLVEASFGHAELVFLDGTTVPPSEAGLRTINNRRTYIWFPYISSGNAIRLSLAGGLEYTVTDPGFKWRPSDLPQCEELVDPTP